MFFGLYNKNLKSIFGGRIYFLSYKNNALDLLKIQDSGHSNKSCHNIISILPALVKFD